MSHSPDPEFAPGTPEEVQDWYRNMHDKFVMTMEERKHRNERFFAELSGEQLFILKDLMINCIADDNLAAYMTGYIAAFMSVKFNLCSDCGLNHDDELHKLLDRPEPAAPTPAPVSVDAVTGVLDYLKNTALSADLTAGTCDKCHGDGHFDICIHPNGAHGQGMGETCPDPRKHPCPWCSAPDWMVGQQVEESPCHPDEHVLLPYGKGTPDTYCCSGCGKVHKQ